MTALARRVAGRRVLFVNAIRADVASGGATATQHMRSAFRSVSEWRELHLAPSGSRLRSVLFALVNLPAPLFVFAARHHDAVWLEFLTRLSVVVAVRCLWQRWIYVPDVVVLNHHACFVYARLFPARTRVLIWHDVPSRKQGGTGAGSGQRQRAVLHAIERALSRGVPCSFVLSDQDRRYLKRAHQLPTVQLPAVGFTVVRRASSASNGIRLLLVGNWTRPENRGGALAFFEALASASVPGTPALQFTLVGSGADAFLDETWRHFAGRLHHSVDAVGRYDTLSQFDALALLVPLIRGAGIKIKTLEAWAADLPVLGTNQAFTGLKPSIWRIGGRRFDSVAALADCCATPGLLISAIEGLRGADAYRQYARQLDV